MHETVTQIKNEISKAIVAQEEMVDALLIGLLCDGHILVEGVPGLAKTSTIKALASTMALDFKRIQFTPDLLPSDIIGAMIYDPKSNDFKIKKGPIFTHLLLADEINRSPSKVQSALLEVMQERQVTIGDSSFGIDAPFLVMATQNPLEQEGVYRLPEAQLDRFMLKVIVKHNSFDDELQIMKQIANKTSKDINSLDIMQNLTQIKEAVEKIHIDPQVEKYILNLVRATRNENPNISYGASPRASIDLYKASKARAFLNHKDFVSPQEVAQMAYPVLRHRIGLSYHALASKTTADDLIKEIIKETLIP
ncbi:MAG: MoxR family ATPase [Campylobacterota bacterium]|nr:MoxR family ATPase [Campylobacterota bacterium]